MRRAQAQTITFVAIDSADQKLLKSGLTLLTSDVKIFKDDGAPANATNAPVEHAGTGVYKLALTADETNCAWISIVITKTGMMPRDIGGATDSQPAAAVVASPAPTTIAFATDLTEAANDFWKGSGIVFTTGALRGQVREIAGYTGATKVITLDVALTAAPASGDRFVLING